MSNTKNLNRPNPEMKEKRKRKNRTRQYKLKILQEIEECTIPGGVAVIIRREGLYSSTISGWRKQKIEGKLDKTQKSDSMDKILEMEKEIRRLKKELYQTKQLIEIQKKISEIIENKN